jgi:hypothetical protein
MRWTVLQMNLCPTKERDFFPPEAWEMAGRRLSAFAAVLAHTEAPLVPATANLACCMLPRRQSMIPIAAKEAGNKEKLSCIRYQKFQPAISPNYHDLISQPCRSANSLIMSGRDLTNPVRLKWHGIKDSGDTDA